MGRKSGEYNQPTRSGGSFFLTGILLMAIVGLAVVLISNQAGVNRRAGEVERAQRDLILLSEEIQRLAEQSESRATTFLDHEKLARERLHWTAPGEYIIRIKDP
ncbi:MAG: hypothetical protein UZ16_OP3001000628 [Candidatus Hinthialibacteria bacterium OLB16]|nr:MAG: hypothetical protein UZ16_OP3001000628 [Candidatus Hinthialibacteria bacterium OLB16]